MPSSSVALRDLPFKFLNARSALSDHGARAGPLTWSPPRLGQGCGTLLGRLRI